ncbi:alanine dehydrogenase [Rhodoligotrophos defluvii]|uniref:alanine dehydrogenase n=1 Tax=Rhodoligotrophos defluvii TaxID=2561934 RepID=UPI0010C99DBD|nr:alanine dehydrogenase [Rhodoligotrophos defluvii]
MLIGVPKEVKPQEYRVGLTPTGVRELRHHGHEIVVQSRAGEGVGLSDDHYRGAGAEIVEGPEEIFARADMIVKVKEPQAAERKMLRPDQVLFTYLHLAPDADQARDLVASGAVCIAYETVTGARGGLPLLAPMSQVAGRMSIQAGAHCLEKRQGGMGLLLGGVPGVAPARVVIIGGGMVGQHAAVMAAGAGADVVILEKSPETMQAIDNRFGARVKTLYSSRGSIEDEVTAADLVIGAVLVPGAAAPKLISRELVEQMKKGSVIVDVAIDQGGCAETSHPTTHADPTYQVDGVVHYCVANMPGGVARTSTFALTNATLPFVVALADKGVRRALEDDPHLRDGLNVYHGHVTCKPVADALNYDYVEPLLAMAA